MLPWHCDKRVQGAAICIRIDILPQEQHLPDTISVELPHLGSIALVSVAAG